MRLGGDERQSAFRAQAARRRVSDGRWAGEVIFLGFPGAQEAGTACRAARINWAGSPEQRGGARFGHRAASRLGQVFAGKGLASAGEGRPESICAPFVGEDGCRSGGAGAAIGFSVNRPGQPAAMHNCEQHLIRRDSCVSEEGADVLSVLLQILEFIVPVALMLGQELFGVLPFQMQNLSYLSARKFSRPVSFDGGLLQ